MSGINPLQASPSFMANAIAIPRPEVSFSIMKMTSVRPLQSQLTVI
jgi:hypothetical protein